MSNSTPDQLLPFFKINKTPLMKKLVTLILFLSIISLQIKAQQVTEKEALQVAGNFLQLQPNELHRQMAADFNSESPSAQPFYLYTFDPQGFIVISAKKFLPPVIAYSFNSNPDPEGRFVAFLKQDLSNRLANQPSTSAQEKSYVKQLWNLYSGVSRKSPLFQLDPGCSI
ncbi:MAG: Spi family protease inhibitor [Bacteroidetes bacterium]|nr:Spi family protease inhibitor [Bacteroidota bacterium]